MLPGGTSRAQFAKEAQQRWPRLKVLYKSGYTEESILHQRSLDQGVESLGRAI
jgi:hypothetical protein